MSEQCEFKQYLIFEPWVQVTFTVLYTLIAVAGLVGNILMIISTLRSRQLWVNTRMYLINMAVSDIIMCITTVPITPYTAFTGNWIFGSLFCHLLPMVQGSAVYISSLSLLGIAWDRFRALNVNNRRGREYKSAFCIIILMDFTSLLFMVPYAWNMELSSEGETEVCSESWKGNYRLSFGILTLLLQFLLPATVRKRNIILLTMLLVFTVGWLPVNILNILEDMEVALLCWPYYYFMFFTFHMIAMLTTSCNPLFYGWLRLSREPRVCQPGYNSVALKNKQSSR